MKRLIPLLAVFVALVAFVTPACNQAAAQSYEVEQLYLHAATAVATGATFEPVDGQQYWQSTTSDAVAVFPLPMHEGDRITGVVVFIENTVASSQVAELRRKSMMGIDSDMLSESTSPATTGNHRLTLSASEIVSGDNQWYLRVEMGSRAGNRVRGLRVSYEPAY